MNITALLLLGGLYSNVKKLHELFLFKTVVQGEEIEENPDHVFIDYSYAPYCNSINFSAEAIPTINAKKGIEIKADDWIVFTRGSQAGCANKVSDLIYNRHHLQHLSQFKIFCSTNVIIIKEKENKESMTKGYADLLLKAFFNPNRKENLVEKENGAMFTLNLAELKESIIELPDLKTQKKFISEYKKIMSSGTKDDFKSYFKQIDEKLKALYLHILIQGKNEDYKI